MVEHDLAKVETRVRFSLSAQKKFYDHLYSRASQERPECFVAGSYAHIAIIRKTKYEICDRVGK